MQARRFPATNLRTASLDVDRFITCKKAFANVRNDGKPLESSSLERAAVRRWFRKDGRVSALVYTETRVV